VHIAGKDFLKGFLHNIFKPTLRPSFPQGLPTPLYLPYGHFWRNLPQGLPIPWAYFEAITGKAFQRASYTIPMLLLLLLLLLLFSFFFSFFFFWLLFAITVKVFPKGFPYHYIYLMAILGTIFPKGFFYRGPILRLLMAESTLADSYTICLPCGHCRQFSRSPLLAVFRRGIPAPQT